MQNTMLDSTVSCTPSTEIRVYKDYEDAPPISGVYVFEVEKGLVKCGMSQNVEKRFSQLVEIKKHREASLHGRAAILPVDREKLKRAEAAFFSLLSGNIEGTELFKISFERALKALRKLYENNPPSMFHLTDEEKAEEKLKDLEREKAFKNALGLVQGLKAERDTKNALEIDKALVRWDYSNDRVSLERETSKFFSILLELFPESVDEISFERFVGEYRHYLYLVDTILSPKVWVEEDLDRLRLDGITSVKFRLDDVTLGRIGALALRLHHVTSSYKDVLKSPVYPSTVVYHAANLVTILDDILNLYCEIIEVDEKYEWKYPDHVLDFFKEVRDTAEYFSRYLTARFVVTIACPEQDVSHFRDELHSIGERLHKLFKEEMKTL